MSTIKINFGKNVIDNLEERLARKIKEEYDYDVYLGKDDYTFEYYDLVEKEEYKRVLVRIGRYYLGLFKLRILDGKNNVKVNIDNFEKLVSDEVYENIIHSKWNIPNEYKEEVKQVKNDLIERGFDLE